MPQSAYGSASEPPRVAHGLTAATVASAALAACGGGGGSGISNATTALLASNPVPSSTADAARFLQQASLAASDADIAALQAQGLNSWLTAQLSRKSSIGHYDYLVASGQNVVASEYSLNDLDASIWRALIAEGNPVVQRLTMFWLEYFVVSVNGLPVAWPQFVAAAYLDLLTSMATANFRDLLKAVTLSPAMGEYLNMRGSTKAAANSNAHPDENYAREVMQLFTLGLYLLNADGSLVLSNGQPVPTYTQADVSGLAAALTGWDFGGASTTPDYARLPMVQVASRHATYSTTFLV